MWIYSQNGFYSIVEDTDNPDLLLVRARVKGDIERIFPKAKVEHTEDHDYAYRARIRKGTVAAAFFQEIKDIDYPNFKDRIAQKDDKERAYWYTRVWTIMTCLQADKADKAA